jgi:Protein of unknown function (DUF3563)
MRPHTHLEQVLRFWLNGGEPSSASASAATTAVTPVVLMQRSSDRAGVVAAPAAPASGNWLARWFDRMEARAWQREQRARDAYLGEATDVIDLEYRIRRYDQSVAAGRPAGSPGYYL